ncbi:SET domain-containing protein, partial [Rhizoclosmatium globosum]
TDIFVDRKPRKPAEIPLCMCVVPEDGSPACGKDCLNRLMQFECIEGNCATGTTCSNQSFQRSLSASLSPTGGLEICETSGRGFGIRTTRTFPKNTFLMEYCGEIISAETSRHRMETIYKDMTHYYFLNYDKSEVIDGCRKGSDARFVNHSCNPNCRIEKWVVNGEYCVGLFTERELEAGEEVTYDYRFESFGDMKKCMCGARGCRGFLGLNKSGDGLSDIKALKLCELFFLCCVGCWEGVFVLVLM